MAEHQLADIFKCFICSKSLDVPKSLACLHNFCRSCICQHIEKVVVCQVDNERQNKFPCPVCKTIFQLPDKITPSTYAYDLPTNKLIDVLIQRENIKHGDVYCGWCVHKGQKQNADFWCDQCSEGLCEECSKFHKKIKALTSHNLIGKDDVDKKDSKLDIEIHCNEHKGKIIENFCYDHQTTCCASCITDYHRKCNHVTTIEKASKGQGKSKSDLMQKINDVTDVVDDFLENRTSNLRIIEIERDDIIKEISLLRNTIVTHLDELELDFKQRFDGNHAYIKKEIEKEIEYCRNHRAIITNCKQLLSIIISHSSDKNVFCEKQIIEQKIKEEEKVVEQLAGDPKTRRYEIVLTPELVNLTESVISIGNFRNTLGRPVQFTAEQLVKLPEREQTPKKHYTAEKIFKFKPEKFPSRNIHGAKILKDDRILLTSCESKLLLIFDTTGNLKKEINMPGEPVDVTLISDNKAAVSYWSPSGIAVVDINTGIITQTNILKNTYIKICGITSDGVKIVAGFEDRILIMDVSGSIKRVIKTPYTDRQRYISFVSEDKVCFSNINPYSVQCIDLDGTEVFTYLHDNLRAPYGITCDDEGVIYVAGLDSYNIHQISPTGQFIKILLTKKNGIKNPFAIHFNLSTKKLLLTRLQKTVTVYQMK